MIDAADLHKSFGAKSVLSGASFSVDGGTVAALVGPNGSGKTTTLHVLAGLATPDAGTARIDGVDVVRDRSTAQAKLAFLPQDVRFHDALTPRQVLRFYADMRRERSEALRSECPRGEVVSGPGGADADRIGAVLQRVDLMAAAEQPCGTLSGGMRQRLGLALLSLSDADILLLDEPGLSLDPDWRRFLAQWLRDSADAGATVLMATHLLEVWRPAVNHVLICADGRIQAEHASTDPVSVSHAGRKET
ncbi:MAG: ATP-binding cassette domain-containing protein [Bacteroidetes bacterium]|jgi:ABC-type multidrug transport system ATPase subunit|nr:ATP-binding cassette domain-containing protein [Bacteroidota bacterium]